MARFDSGWTKAYRKQAHGDLVENVYLYALWNLLRDWATWKETKVLWGGKQRVLPCGSVVFSIKEVSDRWKCSRFVVRKWLKYLQETKRVELESNSSGYLVTICNWGDYQGGNLESISDRSQDESEPISSRSQAETLSKEGKKVRRKKEGVTAAAKKELPILAKIWNEYSAPSQPKVRGCSNERVRKANLRINEGDFRDPKGYWVDIVKRIASSEFCLGKNDRSWIADFDFLIKPDTHHKVLEGKYGESKSSSYQAALASLKRNTL